jgi:hypothetical protein
MPQRILLLIFIFTAACGGARESGARGSSGAPPVPESTVSSEWLKERPSESPWGPGQIPATRKPRWFCFTDIERPERSFCWRTIDACAPGRHPDQCEPHAMAACSLDVGCFPTLTICQAAREAAARDRNSNANEAGGTCLYQE